MTLSARAALVEACLGILLLLGLLQRRAKMGYKDHLAAMQSQLQKRSRKSLSVTHIGLASLCSPKGLTSDIFNDHRRSLENNFCTQKESLTAALHRTSLFAKVNPSKVKFAQKENSLHDSQHPTHPFSHRQHNAHPSRRDTGAVSVLEVITTATDAGTAHKLVALRHCPSSPCDSAAAAADALVSLNDSTTPAVTMDATADAHVSLQETAKVSLTSPHESSALIENVLASHSAPQNLSTMERPFFSPVTAPQLWLPGSSNEGEVSQSKPVYQRLLENQQQRDSRLKDIESEIAIRKSQLVALQSTRKVVFSKKKEDSSDQKNLLTSAAFMPLSEEEEEEVHGVLNGGNRHQILVQHEPSNIYLSRAALQCLRPGAWLNDEVINVYMELLKERERREQKGYLKCHFFNSFFFNKLYKDAHSYDFKAVRRWTTQRKIGYSLLECDKIFVPIHKDIHWCLAVINVREKKLQYLDSLHGNDGNVLHALARYIKDEAKDKGAEDVDTGSWHLDCPNDIPEQMNGCDCGMFMIKYADFLSRGNELKFTQDHMEYFRKRTVLELLQLKAK